MAVEVRDAPRRGPAIISRARLARSRSSVERATALAVLALSFLGSVVAMHGGDWARLAAWPPAWGLIGAGLLLQAVLTWLQWAYGHIPRVAAPARAADAALTAAGFGPLALAGLAGWLAPMLADRGLLAHVAGGMTTATLIAWAILWLVSLLPAWYPESRLVD
jgi:hypothetical protein